MKNHDYCAGIAHGVFLNEETVERVKEVSGAKSQRSSSFKFHYYFKTFFFNFVL